jgi:hypothetical protein
MLEGIQTTSKGEGTLEAARRNTNNGVGRGIQCDRLPQDVRVRAEFVAPEAVAQYRNVVAAGLFVFIGIEKAAGVRLDAEHIEIVGTD